MHKYVNGRHRLAGARLDQVQSDASIAARGAIVGAKTVQAAPKIGGQGLMKLNVNGKSVEVDADGDTPLLWALREQLALTGTKYGCGIAQCGSCTVHIDGDAVRSCAVPINALNENQKIITIEVLSPDGSHPVQKAWLALDVPQCGYCQSGMLMSAAALLAKKPKPTDADIDAEMTNICRCGTYNRVRAGIKLAAEGGVKRG
jgi:isoquinoline 1-oxidoreductase subunit alpha